MKRIRIYSTIFIAFFAILGLLLNLTDTPSGAIASAQENSVPLKTNRITAAGYAPATKELIIISEFDNSWIGVDRQYVNENLLLTLRAAYNNPIEWPGVTIEFEPQPLPGHLPVYYFGQTDDTHHGQVTFEADRLLKAYSLGRDNVANEEMTSNVSCYISVLDKMAELQQQNYQFAQVDPQRFWFEPDMTLDVTVDGTAVTFTQSKMFLQWAYIPPDTPNRTSNASAAAQHFVDCFNNNYDAFAAEQAAGGNTALYELRILGEIAALTKWIQDKNLDSINGKLDGIHYPWLTAYANHSVVATTTITATPAITVSTSFPVPGGTVTQSIYGGVDMGGRENTYNPNANADQSYVEAVATRPEGADEWPINGCLALFLPQSPNVPVDCTRLAFVTNTSDPIVEGGLMDDDDRDKWVENSPFVDGIISGGVAAFGGGHNVSESLSQEKIIQSTLPAGIEPLIVLTFDYAFVTNDTSSTPVDVLNVRLRDKNDALISTVFTISNLSSESQSQWHRESIDLTDILKPYTNTISTTLQAVPSTVLEAGPVKLSIESQTNNSGLTIFNLDNIFLDSNLLSVKQTTQPPDGEFNVYLPVVLNNVATTTMSQNTLFEVGTSPVSAGTPKMDEAGSKIRLTWTQE